MPLFRPTPVLVWSPKPKARPAKRRPPAADQEERRTLLRHLRREVMNRLIDRLDAAIEGERLGLVKEARDVPLHTGPPAVHRAAYLLLLAVLFPDEYGEPIARPRPTDTPPKSAGRVDEYRRRLAAGEKLFDPADADPLKDDGRALRAEKCGNGLSMRVVGWEGGGED